MRNPNIIFIEKAGTGTTYGPIKLTSLMVRCYWRGSKPDMPIFEAGNNPTNFDRFIKNIQAGKIEVKIYDEEDK